jgi:hypothetical protein
MLEPYEGKLSRTVLRGGRSREAPSPLGAGTTMIKEILLVLAASCTQCVAYGQWTGTVNSEGGKITLKAGPGTWTIRLCQPRRSYRFFGGTLGVKVPKGAKLVRFEDVDYAGASISYSKDEFLRIGGGPTWSTGLPPPENLSTSKIVIERTLVPACEELVFGVDVRGIYRDGKRWRFTGNALQTLDYKGVSQEAARFFDTIVDTLCAGSEITPR